MKRLFTILSRVELFFVVDAFDVPKSLYCDQTKKLIRLVYF